MNFSFYTIDSHYCDYLREADSRVPYTMDTKTSLIFSKLTAANGAQLILITQTSHLNKCLCTLKIQ